MDSISISSSPPKRALLLGKGITRSISPQIQNLAFRKAGMNVEFGLLDLNGTEFNSMMRKISRSDDIIGLNITVPFKERVIKHLSSIDTRSKIIGAVNTVKISKPGVLRGFNTDYDGIRVTLEELRTLSGSGKKEGVILGAGGAARACVYTLAKNGFSSILVLNRTMKRANDLADHFRLHFPRTTLDTAKLTTKNLVEAVKGCDLLVNAISSSTKDHFPVEIDLTRARAGMKVFDLGYKEPSLFLKTALNQGIPA
ncbi:MAG: shikimate dehydrogenase family protein, partial [Nitrososphaerales archaeon]